MEVQLTLEDQAADTYHCHGAIIAAGLHIDVNVLFYDRISRYGHFASIACAVDIS
jgi:hypothetical protein